MLRDNDYALNCVSSTFDIFLNASTECLLSEKQSLIKSLFSQGMDRSAIVVYIAALVFLCVHIDMYVHCTQRYKSKIQKCQKGEEGVYQANALISPCDIGLCVFCFFDHGSFTTHDDL